MFVLKNLDEKTRSLMLRELEHAWSMEPSKAIHDW